MDKERIFEILTFGFFMAILAAILDNIGSNLVWWTYSLIPVDYCIIPYSLLLISIF
ncbi:hypothetical protein [Evansella tamaricis]|uniref:Uncharacterized protein n=1 Tax=Evansella tamaricis TaxID=2069301 RepID=A0ABS6JI10_9BACI|nr:hypothetical protein [Evansella tamaricis]MBU9713231.1 hypothetical protein [Evansella tamaricis]